MKRKQFGVQIAWRLAALFFSLLLLAFGVAGDMRGSLLFCLAVVIVLLAVSLVRFVNYTNKELESFLTGLKFGDFQQTYSIAHLGPSFHALEKALHDTVEKFKNLRFEKEQQAIYNQTVVQHIPIPIFIVRSDGRVKILNNATRRTFDVADITNVDEMVNFGASFQRDTLQIQPGEALLTTIELSGAEEYFIMTATNLRARDGVQKLVSLQNIQSQIDATELSAWQNLLRVTSHEIINSLVPVSSCAQAAKTLVDDVLQSGISDDGLIEDMHDIQESLDTVLRRSEGLKRFIQSYRQLSRLPPPKKTKIGVTDYFQHLKTLVQDELARKDIRLDFHCQPEGLVIMADRDMLDQVAINLIRNAADVLVEIPQADISVSGYADSRQRTVLEVSDNGPGIPQKLAEKIFLPFFTTRNQGSGIGLALVRYIMLSHGGTVQYEKNQHGGSTFRLTF